MRKINAILYSLIVLVLILIITILTPEISNAANVNGTNYKNVTVWTHVNITNAKPEILQVIIYADVNLTARNITLNAGLTRTVVCNATVRDWNGYADIYNVNATLWDIGNTTIGAADDNNSHYTNYNCTRWTNGANYTVNYICNFSVYYYANNGTWSCNVTAMDTYNKTGPKGNTTQFYQMYALNVTDGIDYGNVPVEDTSAEQIANITNFGNMRINITVEGYGIRQGDGLAMNCSLNGNITVDNERFAIAPGVFSSKTNLTNASQLVTGLTIAKQTLADTPIINSTYWQLYIPPNPAGNCSGYVIFTAMAP